MDEHDLDAGTQATVEQVSAHVSFSNDLDAHSTPIVFRPGSGEQLNATEYEAALQERERDILRREIELLRLERNLLKESRNPNRNQTSRIPSSSWLRVDDQILPEFDPSKLEKLSAPKWVKKLKSIADIYEWDDKMLLYQAISKLKGAAKFWYDSLDDDIKTWKDFSTQIINSFPAKYDQADIHHELTRRTKKNGESYEVYAYEMAAIGRKGDIDTASIIKYIIAGLGDKELAKLLVVCDITTIQQLLTRIKNYETYDSRTNSRKTNQIYRDSTRGSTLHTTQLTSAKMRCYNCGRQGHKSIDCTEKEKGQKCFACQCFGHVASNCPNRQRATTQPWRKEQSNVLVGDERLPTTHDRFHKIITIESKSLACLLDTGCDLNLMKFSIFQTLNFDVLYKTKTQLCGLGKILIDSIGKFVTKFKLGNDEYEATFHVVMDHIIPIDVILGQDFFQQAKLLLTPDECLVIKKECDMKESQVDHVMKDLSELPSGLCGSAAEHTQVALSVDNPKYLPAVLQICENDDPSEVTKITDIKTKIILTSEEPILQRPRRLACKEKLVVDQQFDYTIEHRPANRMQHADALSRYPVMLAQRNEFLHKLKEAQREDEQLKPVIAILKDNKNYDDYYLEYDVLYKKYKDEGLIVVPQRMQGQIIRKAHEENGHFAAKKTEEVIKREYWIDNVKKKIEMVIQNCITCILSERKGGKQEGFLHPLGKGDVPLQTVHLDHLGPLSSTKKGYRYLLTAIDAFTKFVWIYPTKSTTTKEVIDRLETQKKVFGNPKRFITDKGTAFTSKEFSEYCQKEGIDLVHITTGIPRGNGQVERLNRTIISVLTKLAVGNEQRWYKQVDHLQAMLNDSLQRSIGVTPFELLVGVKMRRPENRRIKELIEEEYIKTFNEQREEIRLKAKEEIKKIQAENKRNFDKRRKKATAYSEGDWVAIKRTQFVTTGKLRPKFIGPYRVIEVRPNERYKVERVGLGEPPKITTCAADGMKRWSKETDDDDGINDTLYDDTNTLVSGSNTELVSEPEPTNGPEPTSDPVPTCSPEDSPKCRMAECRKRV